MPIQLNASIEELHPVDGWLDPQDPTCSSLLYQRSTVRGFGRFHRGNDVIDMEVCFSYVVPAIVNGVLRQTVISVAESLTHRVSS